MYRSSMRQRKLIIALICGMLGAIFMCAGDWLMMYGSPVYNGDVFWLTEGVAQIPAWRNSLSMLVAFPATILYGISLFYMASLIEEERHRAVYHYLTVYSLTPWLCVHLFFVMILYAFAWLNTNGYEQMALPLAEAMRSQFVWIIPLSEVLMVLPFLYWFYLQISSKTVFPKWFAFTNVLIIYGILSIVKTILPDSSFRIGFINGMMNESMFIWFGIMLVWIARFCKEDRV